MRLPLPNVRVVHQRWYPCMRIPAHGHVPPSATGQPPPSLIMGHMPPSIVGQFIPPIIEEWSPAIIAQSPPSGHALPWCIPIMCWCGPIAFGLASVVCPPQDQANPATMSRRKPAERGVHRTKWRIAIRSLRCVASVGVLGITLLDANDASRRSDVSYLVRCRAIHIGQVRRRKRCIECRSNARSTARGKQHRQPGTERRARH
jgi:hypothetical protein